MIKKDYNYKPKIIEFFKTLFWSNLGFDYRINLFETFPKLKAFFYQRKNFAYIRSVGDIIFLVLIFMGLFGPQDPQKNAMLFIAWGVWWSSLVLSWFFLGRMWCAFCPFPGLARLLQNLKLSFFKTPPSWLEKKGIHLSTILFFIIIWLESTSPLVSSPRYTALFLLSIVIFAGIWGVLYKEYAWCRYLCPLGRITGVAATMALIEFRPNYQICSTCKEAKCRKGTENIRPCPVYLGAVSVRNNLNCFICGHCLVLCPKDSPAIYLRHPLKEIILFKGKGITCAFVIPFLIGSQLARFLAETPYYTQWMHSIHLSHSFFFTLLFFFFSFTILIITKIGALIFKYLEDPIFGKFNLTVAILIPFAFTGELIYRWQFFLKNLENFFPTLGRQFHLESFLNLYLHIPDSFIKYSSFFFLILALSGSLYLILYFYYKEFDKEIPFKYFIHFIILCFLTFFSYYFLIFTSI
ncbi:MAG: (4Fe-4S)-binding protein [Caldimicrobium sp.]